MAEVVQILVAAAAGSPMTSLPEAFAVAGRGLEGDRYFSGQGTFSPSPRKPDFEITLIEEENVLTFARDSGLVFTAAQARRNVVTRGIRLNELTGMEFTIGEVRFRAIRLCEPCAHLAKLTSPDILRGLVHKGGLRAQILSAGMIRVGDSVLPG